MMFTIKNNLPLTLSIWIILVLSTGNAIGKRQDELSSMDTIYRARCAARCLSLHITRISTKHFQSNGSLGWCQSHKQCTKCLEPCKDSWEMKGNQCQELCERSFPKKHWECVTSCDFLRTVLAVKQGDCPAPEKASGFAAACLEGCAEDGECAAQKKCCPNGCGHTCQAPKNLYRGAPLKPRKELVLVELPTRELEVRWSSRFNVSAEPVLNVLQRRWNYGIGPNEDSATQWQVVAQTTDERVRLPDIRPGRWYQFRVAAVNVHGTRGFTTPSRHFHSTREPSSPPAPSNLRVSNLTFGPERSASARLRWFLPADSDIPVHHFKVSWSWAAPPRGRSTTTPKIKKRKTTNGAVKFVDLDDLRANRSYTVELQAVTYWGQNQLKSAKTTLQFTTTAHKHPKSEPTASSPGKHSSDILDVGTPFYQDGQLQVRIYWKKRADVTTGHYSVQWMPEYCGHNETRGLEKIHTQENYATLPRLLFSCKYKVTIQPVGTRGQSRGHFQAESTSFFTPSCGTIQAKSPKHIPCPGEGATPPPKASAKPENLTAFFTIHNGDVQGVFTWGVAVPRLHQPFTGFQVTWTEVAAESRRNNLPDSLISQSQILPPERNILVVPGLQLGTHYRLEVQVIGTGGEGPVTTKTFQTPTSSPQLKHEPRLRHHPGVVTVQRH